MKNRKNIWFYVVMTFVIVLSGVAFILPSSCKKERNLPGISTTMVTNVTETSASSGGEITSDGDASIKEKGVCWSTGATPTTANSKTSQGEGTGSFTSNITGLAPNTLYHVCAYATNSVGTAYGTVLSIHTWSGTVTDIDGNVYHTVTIGNQEWMGENLKTKRLNDGGGITLFMDAVTFGSTGAPAYCYIEPSGTPIRSTYGNLYNWSAVSSGKLCPAGWHVPSDIEWEKLVAYLGGDSLAGGKMKEDGTAHWDGPNTGSTNESGLTALPGGFLDVTGGSICGSEVKPGLKGQGFYCIWWSSTESFDNAGTQVLQSENTVTSIGVSLKTNGHSVRCIRN